MITLGVSAGESGCAVAIADRGRVLTALTVRSEQRGGDEGDCVLGCIEQGLHQANISPEELHSVVLALEAGCPDVEGRPWIGTVPIARRYRSLAAALESRTT